MNTNYDDYEEDLIETLKDPKEAEYYLKAALEENDPDVFLLALQHVVKAQGISSIAEKSNKNRANLYKALSEEGNPYFRSIFDVLKAIGMHFSIERNKKNLKHSHAI